MRNRRASYGRVAFPRPPGAARPPPASGPAFFGVVMSLEERVRGLSLALERERNRRERQAAELAELRLEIVELKTTVKIWAAISGAGAGLLSVAGTAAARTIIGG